MAVLTAPLREGTRRRVTATANILVVDPDPWVRHVISEVVDTLGYRAMITTNSRDALELAAANPHGVGLLLTSVVLPKSNGLELAATLMRWFRSMKVIYMSGPNDAVKVQGAIHPGSDALLKPFTNEQLAYKLGLVLGRVPEQESSS